MVNDLDWFPRLSLDYGITIIAYIWFGCHPRLRQLHDIFKLIIRLFDISLGEGLNQFSVLWYYYGLLNRVLG